MFCNNCGGSLEVNSETQDVKCPFCGAVGRIPISDAVARAMVLQPILSLLIVNNINNIGITFTQIAEQYKKLFYSKK